jgi:protein-disulfide isomerase
MSGKSSREARREERLRAEGESEQGERRKRLLQLGSAAVFLAIVVVAVLIVVSANKTSGGDTNLEDVGLVASQLKGIPQNDLVLGDPSAKVTLYEFGDLKCPVCKGFSEEIVPKVIDSKVRDGEAKIQFKNFTIIDEESTPAGAAAIAAGEQGRGWNFVELFYRNQGLETASYVTDAFLTEIAKGASVPDIAQWNKDRKSPKTVAEVESTTQEAEKLGFTGTPSFAVEGPGSNGLETLGTPGSSEAIEEAIAAAS